jgi:tetrahydromethanopterin:alpha-L-glutamate ligase
MKKFLVVGANERVHTVSRLIAHLEERKIAYDVFKWNALVFHGATVGANGKTIDLDQYHAAFLDVPAFDIVIKDTQERIAFKIANEFDILVKQCLTHNVYVMNGAFKLQNPYYNKFSQSVLFDLHQIPAIPTLHPIDNRFDKVLSMLKEHSFDFPVVIKQSQGGMGLNVWKADTEQELEDFLKDKRNLSLVYQPFLENDGDYRVLAIGGKSLGIMRRVAQKGEWRNNFSLGGAVEKFESPEMERFVEDICQKMGLEYAGVDVLKTKDGFRIIEINLFACFEGFEQTYPEINIAERIVDTMIELSSKR